MGKESKLVEFSTPKLFEIRACMITAQKAKPLDATTMFTYSHAIIALAQSERAYYLSYFINDYVGLCMAMYGYVWLCILRLCMAM